MLPALLVERPPLKRTRKNNTATVELPPHVRYIECVVLGSVAKSTRMLECLHCKVRGKMSIVLASSLFMLSEQSRSTAPSPVLTAARSQSLQGEETKTR